MSLVVFPFRSTPSPSPNLSSSTTISTGTIRCSFPSLIVGAAVSIASTTWSEVDFCCCIGTGIDMFEIGLSLALRLGLHLLLYQVQQQHKGLYFVHRLLVRRYLSPGQHPFHGRKSILLLLSVLISTHHSKSDYHRSFVSVSTSFSCIIKFNSKSKWTNLFRTYIL